ncbi:MAG: hypothetical protein OEV00_15080, partial [Acidobacteriota bacterium]|nr:hypothetical protein [Acidobacteriota bacterium]
MNRRLQAAGPALILGLLLVAPGPLDAAEIVKLTSGQTLRVASIHPVGNQVELRLEGGGSLQV